MEADHIVEYIPKEQNLLQSHSTASIVEIFSRRNDSTEDFIQLVKDNLHEMRKLHIVYGELSNISLLRLIEETQSNIRNYRSAFLDLVLHKSVHSQKSMHKNEEEKSLYTRNEINMIEETAVLPRSNDVDFSIRLSVLQYIQELPFSENEDAKNFNQTHFDILINELADRNEMIRKKAIKIVFKKFISRLDSKTGTMEISQKSIRKFIVDKKMNEKLQILIRSENSQVIKSEALKIILSLFIINQKENHVKEKELFRSIRTYFDSYLESFDHNRIQKMISSTLATRSLKVLTYGVLYDVAVLHRIMEETNIFYLSLCKINMSRFLKESIRFIQENSSCCSSGVFCLFDVFIVKKRNKINDIKLLHGIFEICRDNDRNVYKIILLISTISNLIEFHNNSIELLERVIQFGRRRLSYFGEAIATLLKSTASDFREFTDNQISQLLSGKEGIEAQTFLIREFDIDASRLSMSSMTIVDKVYYALWRIKDLNFISLSEIFTENSTNQEVEIEKFYKEIIEFIIYFHTKCEELSPSYKDQENESTVLVDSVESACCYMLNKLLSVFEDSSFFNSEEKCLYLWRLIELGYFASWASRLFRIVSQDKVCQIIKESKQVKSLFVGFVEQLLCEMDSEKNSAENIISRYLVYSKLFSMRIPRRKNFSYVFDTIKENIDRITFYKLHDTIFINFASFFTLNESIVIEAILPEGKLKSALLKKITSRAAMTDLEKENVTII